MRNKTVGKWYLWVVSLASSCPLKMPPRETLCVSVWYKEAVAGSKRRLRDMAARTGNMAHFISRSDYSLMLDV